METAKNAVEDNLQDYTAQLKGLSLIHISADGELITPQTLEYGTGYSLVEVQAPYGYVLDLSLIHI